MSKNKKSLEDQTFKSNKVLHSIGEDFGKGFFKDFQKGFTVTLKTAFRPPVTLMYPFEVDAIEPRFRGIQALITERCIACGICARACPNGSILMQTAKDEENKKVLTEFQVDLGKCIFCGLCAESCPKGALKMSGRYDYCCDTREGLIFNIKQLEENCKYIQDK